MTDVRTIDGDRYVRVSDVVSWVRNVGWEACTPHDLALLMEEQLGVRVALDRPATPEELQGLHKDDPVGGVGLEETASRREQWRREHLSEGVEHLEEVRPPDSDPHSVDK